VPHRDVPFYLALMSEICAPVLELCCGTGRLTIPLATHGHEITGIDISHEMLSRLKHKIRSTYPFVSRKISLCQADMTTFCLDRRFGAVLVAYHSIQILMDDVSVRKTLRSISTHLTEDGILILNFIEPVDDMRSLLGSSETKVMLASDGVSLIEKTVTNTSFDTERRVVSYAVQHRKIAEPSAPFCIEQLSTRTYTSAQMNSLLTMSGFSVESVYRGFSLGDGMLEVKHEEREVTFVCRKKLGP
jgi:SAM-dependent methyltransferase